MVKRFPNNCHLKIQGEKSFTKLDDAEKLHDNVHVGDISQGIKDNETAIRH